MDRAAIYIDEALRSRLKAAAAAQGRSEAALLREALERYLPPDTQAVPEPVGESHDGGVARHIDRALEDLGFGTR